MAIQCERGIQHAAGSHSSTPEDRGSIAWISTELYKRTLRSSVWSRGRHVPQVEVAPTGSEKSASQVHVAPAQRQHASTQMRRTVGGGWTRAELLARRQLRLRLRSHRGASDLLKETLTPPRRASDANGMSNTREGRTEPALPPTQVTWSLARTERPGEESRESAACATARTGLGPFPALAFSVDLSSIYNRARHPDAKIAPSQLLYERIAPTYASLLNEISFSAAVRGVWSRVGCRPPCHPVNPTVIHAVARA